MSGEWKRSVSHRGRVGRGGCPPRPPTDPGVPNSGTRLFRPRLRPWPGGHGPEALSAVVLLRWSQGSESLASIPPTVSWPGAPFPRRGPSGRFPRVHGSMGRSDSPPPVPPRFVAFARAVSRSHPRFAPVAAMCAGHGPGVGHPVLPPGFAEEASGPPRFLGDPCVSVPCSPTPAGPRAPGRCGAAARPSVTLTTSAPANLTISGLNRTARALAVHASQRRLPGRHARLAAGCWPGSAGRGWLPAGSHRKVSACGFPLSQAFLAH